MSQIAEQVGMDYSEAPDFRYLAQPVNDFLFLWEEEWSVEKPNTFEQDEEIWIKDSSERTNKTTTGDGGKTSFAPHWEIAKLFSCSTVFWIVNKLNGFLVFCNLIFLHLVLLF